MNKAKHYLQTANKAPSPPQSDTTLPRHGQSKAPLGLRARLCPAAGRASPCWSLGVPPDIPEHQGSLQGSDSLRRRPHTATTTQPSGDGPSPPRRRDKPSRGTIPHQLKPNLLARCCPRSSGEQEPGWSSWEFHIPRLKSVSRTVHPAAPRVLLSPQCLFTSELTTHRPRQAEKQNPKQVLRFTVEGEGKEGR